MSTPTPLFCEACLQGCGECRSLRTAWRDTRTDGDRFNAHIRLYRHRKTCAKCPDRAKEQRLRDADAERAKART